MESNPNKNKEALGKKRYEELKLARQPFLTAAEDYAKETLPRLFQDEAEKGTQLVAPSQTVGSEGTKHLSSKLILTLFPPNTGFHRLHPNDIDLINAGLSEEDIDKLKQELDGVTSKIVRSLESGSFRSRMTHAAQLMIISGNALMFDYKADFTKVYSLKDYVVRRDGTDDVVESVIKDRLNLNDFYDNPKAHDQLTKLYELSEDYDEKRKTNKFDVYTHLRFHEGRHYWRQEAFGQVIEGTDSDVKFDETPWYFLRWSAIDGVDYGYSLIEDVIHDLVEYGALKAGIMNFTDMATKLLWLVRSGSGIDVNELNKAESGEFVSGNIEHIAPLIANVSNNISWLQGVSQEVKKDLHKVFLLNTAIQRDGERVTAEEIRYMARELEVVHGGLYTTLANELQKPLVKNRIRQLREDGQIPNFPMDKIDPTITTGIEALEKGAIYQKKTQWLGDMTQLLGPDAVMAEVSPKAIMQSTAEDQALDISKLLKSDEEKAQEAQAIQEQQMTQAAMGPMAQEGAKAMMAPPQE